MRDLRGDTAFSSEDWRAAHVRRCLVCRASRRDPTFNRRIAGRLAENMAPQGRRGATILAMGDGA